MQASRRTAALIGVLFLTATASYLAAGQLMAAALDAPANLADLDRGRMTAGVLLELVNCAAVVGIGVMLFPILRRHSERIALGYAATRIIESAVMVVSALGPAMLVVLSREQLQAGSDGASALRTFGALAMEWHDAAFQMAMIGLGIGSLLFCAALYRTRPVPRALAVLGFVGYVALLVHSVLELSGYEVGAVLFVPGGIFEAVLPIWLTVRGFNAPTPHDGAVVGRWPDDPPAPVGGTGAA